MIRVLALLSLILLAGCTATGMTATPIVIANVGPVSLSFADFPDAPNRVQDNFYSTFAVDAPIRGIPFDPGDSGTVIARGYLSVAGSASGTLLIYVFDFVDQDGNRLTRVGGQMSTQQAPNGSLGRRRQCADRGRRQPCPGRIPQLARRQSCDSLTLCRLARLRCRRADC